MHATVRGLLLFTSFMALAAEPRLPADSALCVTDTGVPTPATALCEQQAGARAEEENRPDLALSHYLAAHSIWQFLGPDHMQSDVLTLINLGTLYGSQGRIADAEKTLNQALAFARAVAPGYPVLQFITASRLGAFYTQTAMPDRGRALLDEAITKLRTPELASLPDLAYACNARGMADLWNRDYAAAEAWLREAVAAASQDPGEDSPKTAAYEANLAVTLYFRGQNARAEVLLHRARYITETRLGVGLPLGKILADLSAVESALGEFAAAETDGQQSLAILTRFRDPQSLDVVSSKVLLGTIYLTEHKTTDAARILPDAVEAERRLAGTPGVINPRVVADGIRRLGQLRAQQNDWREAESLYRESLNLYESNLTSADPALAPVLSEYVNVLKHNGAPRAEVKRFEARVKAIKS